MTVAGRGLMWPGAGGRWLPVWLPHIVSAANLQRNERKPETLYSPAMAARERSMTVSPMSSHRGLRGSRRETHRAQHHPVQARVEVGLPATAARADLLWSPPDTPGRFRAPCGLGMPGTVAGLGPVAGQIIKFWVAARYEAASAGR